MKLLFISMIIFLSAQPAITQNTVIVSGTISHPKDDKVYIKYYKDYISYAEGIADSAILDKKGNFNMRFTWSHAYPVTFYHGEEITEMFLSPGDSLNLNLDTEQFDETVKYEGRGAVINNYLAQKTLLFPTLSGNEYKLEEKEFTHLIDSIHSEKLGFFSKYFSEASIHDQSVNVFKQYEDAEINYRWAMDKTSYPMYYKYFNKPSKPQTLSPDYYNFMKEILPFNYNAVNSMTYQQFLIDYVDGEVRELLKADTTQSLIGVKNQYINENLTGELKVFILAEWAYSTLTEEGDLESGKKIMDLLTSFNPEHKYKELLNRTLSIATRLQQGNPAPDFTLPDLQAQLVSLSDFKGKIVYIDFWASWCGPCRSEIPYAQKLEKRMKGKDVVFLYVSIDDDEEAWKKIIKEKGMNGVHLISKGNFESDVAHQYNIIGIPHYFIIGKDGRIVDNNASRPSEDIQEELEKLLN